MSKLLCAALPLALLLAAPATAQDQPAPSPTPPPQSAAPADKPPEAAATPSPQQPAPPEAKAVTPGAVVFTVHTKRPTFIAMTPATGALALVGAAISIHNGSEMVEMFGLTDPGNDIAPGLAKLYATSKGLSVADAGVPYDGDSNKALLALAADPKTKATGAQYLVDVTTYSWETLYFPLDWTHFGVMYGAWLKVIDLASGKVIVEGRCFQKPQKGPEAPTNSQLTDNRGEILKKISVDAAQRCAEDLKSKTLKF
jgi:hypothetical protein